MTESQSSAQLSEGPVCESLTGLPAKQEYYGPRGFRWLVPGRLAGTPRPGLFYDLNLDLNALSRMGVRAVFTLTEEWNPGTDPFEAAGLTQHYFSIPDLCPPTDAQAVEICQIVDGYMEQNQAVVFHCHAGKGRTGTLLAAQFVWRGLTADEAITATRAMNRNWIESDSQIDWLHSFAQSDLVSENARKYA